MHDAIVDDLGAHAGANWAELENPFGLQVQKRPRQRLVGVVAAQEKGDLGGRHAGHPTGDGGVDQWHTGGLGGGVTGLGGRRGDRAGLDDHRRPVTGGQDGVDHGDGNLRLGQRQDDRVGAGGGRGG